MECKETLEKFLECVSKNKCSKLLEYKGSDILMIDKYPKNFKWKILTKYKTNKQTQLYNDSSHTTTHTVKLDDYKRQFEVKLILSNGEILWTYPVLALLDNLDNLTLKGKWRIMIVKSFGSLIKTHSGRIIDREYKQ